ncbi:MAG: AN1-type zinc finger domain-containing protein [Candidatus Bathyarchaeia archaeon]
MKCQYCGLDVDLPFKCPFCGRYFCAEHRLPEFHVCQGIKRGPLYHGVPLGRLDETIKVSILRRFSPGFFRFLHHVSSLVELAHLTLGVLLVMLVGFSLSFSEIHVNLPSAFYLALIFTLSFILHEIGHKFTAKYYGLWAEFRLSLIGIMITLISVFSPIIKIISPGAVVISGEATRENLGKIALSGPIINISLSILLLALNLTLNTSFKIILAWGSIVNAYVAVFNLIPFGFLDGAKIFWWNKYVWIISFLMALTLVAINLIF